MRRFERIFDVVESVEEYRPGGYHPVHLHDLFNHRYEVAGKLAYGQFSTVWLARDRSLQQYVALKILKSDCSKTWKELDNFLCFSASDLQHPGRKHCLELLDYFKHNGPNGTHLCLVLPMMMSDGEAMTVREKDRRPRYIRTVSKQILKGLDFLHAAGIIHCDLQPANILFSLLDTEFDDSLLNPPEFSPVKWLDGKEADNSAPRYLMTSQRPRGMLDDAEVSKLIVKIGDMGGAIQSTQSSEQPVTPTALRAPELIHGHRWDPSIDVWALGCLIFQLATNEPLFPLSSFGSTVEQVNVEHETMMRRIIDDDENDRAHAKFRAYLAERIPSGFGTKNIDLFTSFLMSMLQKDQRARKSTTELLSHPFLVGEKLVRG